MNQARLLKILAVVFAVPLLGALLWYSVKKEAAFTLEVARSKDTAPALAELHRQASQGTLKLMGTEGLEMTFISAGFPPKKPLPALEPRARLVGGALVEAGRLNVAATHYTAAEGRFTLFLIPADKEFLPADTAKVQQRGRTLLVVKRDGVTLTLWKTGFWYSALATEMPDGDRNLFVDLVIAAQG